MDDDSCLAPYVDCYNVAPIRIGRNVTVSQYTYLCSATHDYSTLQMPLTSEPIVIGDYAWVCADVFVGPGVTVHEGAVVGARSSVFRDVPKWTVVAGTPARYVKDRVLEGRADVAVEAAQ